MLQLLRSTNQTQSSQPPQSSAARPQALPKLPNPQLPDMSKAQSSQPPQTNVTSPQAVTRTLPSTASEAASDVNASRPVHGEEDALRILQALLSPNAKRAKTSPGTRIPLKPYLICFYEADLQAAYSRLEASLKPGTITDAHHQASIAFCIGADAMQAIE